MVSARLRACLVVAVMLVPVTLVTTAPVGAAGSAEWGEPQLVAKSADGGIGLVIAVDGDVVHRLLTRRVERGDTVVQKLLYERSVDGGDTWTGRVRLGAYEDVRAAPGFGADGGFVHVAWPVYRDDKWVVMHRGSTDGGVTWSERTQAGRFPGSSLSPIKLAVDRRFVHLFADSDSNEDGYAIFHARSSNRGRTWSSPVRVSPRLRIPGRFEVAASGGNVHLVFIRWDVEGDLPVVYRRSNDAGVTWQKGIRLFKHIPTENADWYFEVAAHGQHVYVIDRQPIRSVLMLRSSSDAGASWSPRTRIRAIGTWDWFYRLAASGRWVHLVWENACFEDWTVCEGGPDSQILHQRSGNQGTTWTKATSLPLERPNGVYPEVKGLVANKGAAHIAYISYAVDETRVWAYAQHTE